MTNYYPFLNVSINPEWNDSKYQHGRPNMTYNKMLFENNVEGVILSGLTLASDGKKVCWTGHEQLEIDWAKPLTQVLKDADKKIGISFGGIDESTQDISMKFSIDQIQDTYSRVIEDYGLDHLDVCLIKSSFNNVEYICKALKKIMDKYNNLNISFTLPASIHGLNPTGLSIVKSINENGLLQYQNRLVINLLTTGYYMDEWKDKMGEASIQVIKSVRDQLKQNFSNLNENQLNSMIGITPMIGKNIDTYIFTVEDANVLGKYAKENNLPLVSCWCLNRDNPCSPDNDDAESNCSSNLNQKESCEYTRAFVNSTTKS